jgi:hypothetical protein
MYIYHVIQTYNKSDYTRCISNILRLTELPKSSVENFAKQFLKKEMKPLLQ